MDNCSGTTGDDDETIVTTTVRRGDAPTHRTPRSGRIELGAFARDPTWDGRLGADLRPSCHRGDLLASRYRLVRRIARGGMGTVWEAHDERLHRDVAVKLLGADSLGDGDLLARFQQESRVVAALSNAHVIAVFDEGVADGVPYIVLERLSGEDLHHRLTRVRSLSLDACDRLVTHVARGLDAAHAAGIVHRDIKPSNIFLVEGAAGSEGAFVAKILDFGVAKRGGPGAVTTRTGVVLGTPQFMSPEQLRGSRDVDARADVFSLAAVLYLCVTGHRPFGGDPSQAMVRIGLGTFTPPSRLVSGLPRALDALFAQALALEPRHRFPTPGALAHAFRHIAGTARPREPPTPLPRVATLGIGVRPPATAPCAGDATVALRNEQAAGFVEVRPRRGLPSPERPSPWARRPAARCEPAPSRGLATAVGAVSLLVVALAGAVACLVSGG